MNEFEFNFSDLDINEFIKDESFDIVAEEIAPETPKRLIQRVGDMTNEDKLMVERIIRYNNSKYFYSVESVMEKIPNTEIIDYLMKHVGLTEILAYNLVIHHRYALLANNNYTIFFNNVKKSTFTKASMKHLNSRY